MRASVIIPFHRDLRQLEASLSAIRATAPAAEVVVAADGARDDCHGLAHASGARVIDVPGPSGPAVARNRGADVATGDILVFVDADVVVRPGAIDGLCQVLADEPGVAAIFGAYDETPACTNFMSQYRNLSHAYVHETGSPDAVTFWAGLGAVRADVFRAVGGFDERFPRPSIEDIDLGYRLTRAGFRIRLDPRFRGCHLKRWTLASAVKIDVVSRGVPWAQLMLKFRLPANDLNLRRELRLSVVLAYLTLACLLTAWWSPWMLAGAAAALGGIWWLSAPYYRWFARTRGTAFAARVFPPQVLHHLCNGLSFVVGTSLSLAARAGVRLPGALPLSIWRDIDRAGTAPVAPPPSPASIP